jgi:hypothetical protein
MDARFHHAKGSFVELHSALAVILVFCTAACTHEVVVSGSSAPAAEVMANRVIRTPTTYSFSPDLQDAHPPISFDGVACSAHTYNLNIGPAIKETLVKATEAGFSNASPGSETVRAPYNIRFDLEDLSAHLNVIPGFFSTKISAHIEITARTDVTDGQGTELARAVLEGQATEVRDGGCFNADVALTAASDKALRRLGTDYVYKIINTNVLH